MKKFVLMHCGFEKPTPEIMEQWMAWFGSVKDQTIENIGFGGGKEISASGTVDLGWDSDAITGITIVEAADLDAAVKLTEGNPYINSIRVYAVREH